MSSVRFELDLYLNGTGRLVVDGTDISTQVRSISVDSRVGQPPRLLVEQIGEGHIEGVAELTVVAPLDLAAFFRDIDPEELEKAALARLGFGEDNATRAMLDVLSDWAQGKG